MEDVVLHLPSGSAQQLDSLLKRTEKLLEPFACRTPPVFNPWFLATGTDRQRPIRPLRPAPVISSWRGQDVLTCPPEDSGQTEETPGGAPPAGDASPLRRSWSIFGPRGVLLPTAPSKHFHRAVSKHQLHPRQRARWVIGEDNCGVAKDIEQVWRVLTRSVLTSRLPTCNANIQRERAEIWVFCDVACSEQVGRLLKDDLRLTGRIGLEVHRVGTVLSM
ncbi:shieldin complex subunit 3 [Brachyistius frenatus]|uniref:shieldin complex subunit 3 n=1 Tax=Brachyistius frenatus TaxID=100188 RepID=UPI0037E8F117